jgi:hypothetical protein
MKILVVSCFLFLIFAIAIAASFLQEPAKQADAVSAQLREPDRETVIRNSLASLLTSVGVRVEATLPTISRPTYRALHVRWDSAAAGGQNNLVKQPSHGALTLLSADRRQGSLPRERSLDLSTNQLLAIGIDEKQSLRWWKPILDPRLVRAEVPNDKGELGGEELYLANVEFWISIPDDPSIKEVRLYQPRWTGKEFQLEPVTALTVE